MRNQIKIALAILFIALVGMIVWQMMKPPDEPVYKGRPLSSWLKANRKWNVNEADDALLQAGTNAIPTLLRLLRVRDSALKVMVMELVQRQNLVKVEFTPAAQWNLAGADAFLLLGTNAQSAVPALVEIAEQNISSPSLSYAIGALGFIGPPARQAVPLLLRSATNADTQVRSYAVTALGRILAEPDRVVPVLISALHDPEPRVRSEAVCALRDFGLSAKLAVPGEIQAEPDRFVAVLMGAMHDPHSMVQREAVRALGQFGPRAKLAVSALVEFLNTHPNSELGGGAANALKAIDPEAAAKAGVK